MNSWIGVQRSILCALAILVACPPLSAQTESEKSGAKVFYTYCTLCHGPNGMGEGPLAIAIENYPNVNLMTSQKDLSLENIVQIVKYGSQLDNVGDFMPPWIRELTKDQIQNVSEFVAFLRERPVDAGELLRAESENAEPNIEHGKVLYQSYCLRCHGSEGKGDGKMIRIVNSPPPFNLTKSVVNRAYVRLIVRNGGEFVGRSPQMPPWKDELSEQDILSISDYVMTLRKTSGQNQAGNNTTQ